LRYTDALKEKKKPRSRAGQSWNFVSILCGSKIIYLPETSRPAPGAIPAFCSPGIAGKVAGVAKLATHLHPVRPDRRLRIVM
jgi:hypothetical protein